MFTGLVEAVATVTAVEFAGGGARLSVAVRWPEVDGPTRLGDSIAVNGACLTAIAIAAAESAETLTFDLSHETLARTTFAHATAGQRVNVERALLVGDRLGGHIVTGHVTGSVIWSARPPIQLAGTWSTVFLRICSQKLCKKAVFVSTACR